MASREPSLLKSFFHCIFLTSIFLFASYFTDFIYKFPYNFSSYFKFKIPSWYETIIVPIGSHILKTIICSIIASLVGTFVENGHIFGFNLSLWSTRATIGRLVASTVSKYSLGHGFKGPKIWSLASWLTSVGAFLIGMFVLYLRDIEDFKTKPYVLRVQPYRYWRFVTLCCCMFLYQMGTQIFNNLLESLLEKLFGAGQTDINTDFIYATAAALGAELFSCLVPSNYREKQWMAYYSMTGSICAIGFFDIVVFYYIINPSRVSNSFKIISIPIYLLLLVIGILCDFTLSVLKQAASIDTRSGQRIALAVFILDLIGGVFGRVAGDGFYKLMKSDDSILYWMLCPMAVAALSLCCMNIRFFQI